MCFSLFFWRPFVVQNMGGALCRTANACHSPRAAGVLHSLWLDKESGQQHGTLQNACKGLPSDPWQQSFQGMCTQIRIRKIASCAYYQRKEGRTRKPVWGEGKQVISRGKRGLYVICQAERLECTALQTCSAWATCRKPLALSRRRERNCLGSSDCSKFKVGR